MKKMDEKKQILVIRVLVAFFIVVSAVIAIMQYYSANAFIAQLMGISWALSRARSSLRSSTGCT